MEEARLRGASPHPRCDLALLVSDRPQIDRGRVHAGMTEPALHTPNNSAGADTSRNTMAPARFFNDRIAIDPASRSSEPALSSSASEIRHPGIGQRQA